MLLILQLTNLNLPPTTTLISTTWRVFKDHQMTDLLVDSIDDTIHKTFIEFDVDIPRDTILYTEVQCTYSTGISEKSPIRVIKVKDINEIDMTNQIPHFVNRPILTTEYDINNHPNDRFTITASNFFSETNQASLLHTSWSIEKTNGEVVWCDINNYVNKTTINPPIRLTPEEIYIIKATFTSTAKVQSQIGSLTIFCTNSLDLDIHPQLTVILPQFDLPLWVRLEPMDHLDWQLYKENILITSGTSNTSSFMIPKEYLEANYEYSIGVAVTHNGVQGDYKYDYFRPIDINVQRDNLYIEYPIPHRSTYFTSTP